MSIRVIIPNYNKALYLIEMFGSLSNQTYQDFDVLFIDDGSTDESVEIAQQYVNTILINETNLGIPKTLNKGFEESKKYTFCIILASDDIIEPTWIEEMVKLQKEENADVVTTAGKRFGLDTQGFDACSTGMYATKMWKKLKGRKDIQYVHDIEMAIRIYKGGYKKRSVNKPLYNWRHYEKQDSRQAGNTDQRIAEIINSHGLTREEYRSNVAQPNFN